MLINGTNFESAGVPSWPVVDGDEIGAADVFAMILFRDGRRILLERHSRVRMIQANGRTDVVLLSGKVDRGPHELKVDAKALARRLPYRMGFTGNR